MAISLVPSKIFLKKSFPSICQTEEQEEGTFVFSFEFFSQFLSFFIYLFIPPLFILLLSLEWRTETSNTLVAFLIFSAADAPGFLFIFFHFPSRFTPRYDILNCMSGKENGHKKRKQSQQNKREKPFLGWKEVMIQYGDHTARRTRRKYFWSASAVSIVFSTVFPI